MAGFHKEEILEKDIVRFKNCFKLYSDCGLGRPTCQYIRMRTGLNQNSVKLLSKKFNLIPCDLKNPREVSCWNLVTVMR